MPRRIEVIVPHEPVGEKMLSVTLIDTQGIDDVAGMPTLSRTSMMRDTIVALCTKFDEAPSVHIRDLLRRAKEAAYGHWRAMSPFCARAAR